MGVRSTTEVRNSPIGALLGPYSGSLGTDRREPLEPGSVPLWYPSDPYY